MKNVRPFVFGFIFACVLLTTTQIFAGVAGFKTDLIAAFTANFTAGQRTTIANSFVSAYQNEWNARVAAGTADNAANRGLFAIDKIIEHVQTIVRAEQHKTALNAVPMPTPLPQ